MYIVKVCSHRTKTFAFAKDTNVHTGLLHTIQSDVALHSANTKFTK